MGCPPNSSQSPEIYAEEEVKDGKNQGWWMTSREQHLPDLLHIWPNRDCVIMPKSCMASNQTQTLALRRESRFWVPTLTNKLFATDTFWKREKPVFSNGVTQAYLLDSTASTMPRKSRPTWNRFHVFLCTFILFHWFNFILRKRHRNNQKVGCVGKQRYGRTLGKGINMIKIYCRKIFK